MKTTTSPEATGHQQFLKDINRMALVRLLLARPGLSRADLSQESGLTKSTVSMLVRELIAEGWMEEREVVATGDLGRRPTPLFINPAHLTLLGAELGIDSLRVVAVSLTGDVLARQVLPCQPAQSADQRLTELAGALERTAAALVAQGRRVVGVGLGLPGGVNEEAGTLIFAPNLGWHDVPVRDWLSARLARGPLAQVPVQVQNEADVAALGELEFNPEAVADPLLYISLNQGVGAGVIVGDRLLTGRHGFAGEVGHMVLQMDGPLCSCGRQGCAEALISPRAIWRMAAEQTAGSAQALSESESEINALQARLAAGDAQAAEAVSRSGRYLGVLLQNLAAAYDPGCIVLGGSVVELGEAFVTPALNTLATYSAAAQLEPPQVRTSRLGPDAVAIGAAALVRYRLTRPLHAVANRLVGTDSTV